MKIKENISGIAELTAAAVLTVGPLTFFKACGAHDGKYMACHWAQNAVVLLGAVLILIALLRIILPDIGIKTGLSISAALVSASVILIPGRVIALCMMDTMRCHSIFRPAVTVTAAVLLAISVIDIVIGLKKTRRR